MALDLDNSVTDYWSAHFAPLDLCSLCGNSGTIDTRGVKTRAGVLVGRVNWCICPNGQSLRDQKAPHEPEQDGHPW